MSPGLGKAGDKDDSSPPPSRGPEFQTQMHEGQCDQCHKGPQSLRVTTECARLDWEVVDRLGPAPTLARPKSPYHLEAVLQP
jgi:hypothetical protein